MTSDQQEAQEDVPLNQDGWRRVRGEWRHARYGLVRMSPTRNWEFQDFTGKTDGGFVTAAEAREALESEWQGWHRTATGLAYKGFGTLDVTPEGVWVARAPSGRELAASKRPMDAVLAIHRYALPILRSGLIGSAAATLGGLFVAIAPSMAGIVGCVWAVAFAVGLAHFMGQMGQKPAPQAALVSLVHALGIAGFGFGFAGIMRGLDVDWHTVGWALATARVLFILGAIFVVCGRLVAWHVENLATAEPARAKPSN